MRTLHTGGRLVEAEFWDRDGALGQTKDLLAQENLPALFEAAFLQRRTFVRCDVLERVSPSDWALWEVKAVARPSEQHLFDLAVQTLVINESLLSMNPAVKVVRSGIMHLADREAVKELIAGSSIMFRIGKSDLSGEVAQMSLSIGSIIDEATAVADRAQAPDVKVGNQCHKPYECAYLGAVC